MKKIFLEELNEEDLKTIIKNNEKFMQQYGENLMELRGEDQTYEAECIFGKDWQNYIDLRDNYSSFYLRVKDCKKFIYNLAKEYLSISQEELYTKALSLVEDLDNLDWAEDNAGDIEDLKTEQLEGISKELLGSIEKELHIYENYPDEEELLSFIMDNEYYIGYYTDEDMKNIYIDRVEKF